ncbi:MAG: serine/threonine-protein kinase [Planctomycetota bacterium]
MASTEHPEELDEDDWNRLQEIVERFESDCATAYPRDIASYLPPPSDPVRASVLQELVRSDLELGWRHGQGLLVEHYEQKFPELRSIDCRLELMEDEFRLRQNFGDRPTLDEYSRRFPEEWESFQKRVGESLVENSGGSVSRSDARTLPAEATRKLAKEDSLETNFAMTGRFKKIRKIGEGGFGEVWEAQAPGGVPVAVKRVHGAVSAKAVEREKKSLDLICSGRLRHPFLLQVFSWWVQDDRLHIMMELADGSLDDKLKEAKKAGLPGIPKEELKQVMIDAASALDFLNHERNILHRDVKPANMLLMGNRLKLCDFGLSRMSQNLAIESGKTMGAGTPIFIAPEIIEGHQSLHSDQYSLAASYYMLRAGRPVFRGRIKEIRRQHVEERPQFDDDVLSQGEKEVLWKAMSKLPEDRYPSSSAFVQALIAAMDQATVNATAVAEQAHPLASTSTVVDRSAVNGGGTAPPAVASVDSPSKPSGDSIESEWPTIPPSGSDTQEELENEVRTIDRERITQLEESVQMVRPLVAETPPLSSNRTVPDPRRPLVPRISRDWNHLKRSGSSSHIPRDRIPHDRLNRPPKRSMPLATLFAIFLGSIAIALLAVVLFSFLSR